MFKTSTLYKAIRECKSDVIVNQGGTSSGKTVATLQNAFERCILEKNTVFTVVGQDIPNLKKGAIRDAETIVRDSDEISQHLVGSFNKSDRFYQFKNGSVMEFQSYDDAQDAKSGKRDYLFINEANGIPKPIYDELVLRTRKQAFIDYNPNYSFWVHESIIPEPNTTLFITDHRHNPFLDEKTRAKIEALRKVDVDIWKVYARGVTGKLEGLVFPNVRIVEEVPAEAKLIGVGLDFGYTNDPSSNEWVYMYNGELYIDELFYETGLTNPDIAKIWMENGVSNQQEIIADSADPKSIQELRNLGYNVIAASKGADSISLGIDTIKRYPLNITRRSVGIRKEQQRYLWAKDKLGKPLNVPVDAFNHGWDSVRYVGLMKLVTVPVKRTGRSTMIAYKPE
ncbi:phage terminase large subunit [Cytophagaceae bacterium YF14B1]|uniref:Phage terminase large subunit n=1 Tax=Xanthocytophaga flava TaxID=3048013 RepID=A0AAE3QTD8_9BACT|nr:phage terminase large subunit [Xanthocytophaga flavus]MDJ1483110.1 phage terminase large subunit [Xanthocytophaga flavus]